MKRIAFVFVVSYAYWAQAANRFWNVATTVSDDWSIGANWSTSQGGSPADTPPGEDDSVQINTNCSAMHPVSYKSSATSLVSFLRLGLSAGDEGYLRVESGSLGSSSQWFVIGVEGRGEVTVTNGATLVKTAGPFIIGHHAGSTGVLHIASGSTLMLSDRNFNTIEVARNGHGTLLLSGSVIIANPTARSFRIASAEGATAGTGIFDIRGGSVSAAESAAVQSLSIGYYGGAMGDATLRGYGTIDLLNANGAGKLQNGGKVIADGRAPDGTTAERTLKFLYTLFESCDNTPGSTHYGWYTSDQGAIELSPTSYNSWGNTALGDDATSAASFALDSASTVLVNSAWLATDALSGGSVKMSLLDPSRAYAIDNATVLPGFPSGVTALNIWQLDVGEPVTITDFTVRYDERHSNVNAADKHGQLLGFYTWDGVSDEWTEQGPRTTIDPVNYLAAFSGSLPSSDSRFFALSAQQVYPSGSVMLIQ